MKQLLMLIAILALLPFAACTLTMSGCTYGLVSGARATTVCTTIGDTLVCNNYGPDYLDRYSLPDTNPNPRPVWRNEYEDYAE